MTEKEKIQLLSDNTKTNDEISKLLNCSVVTVSRQRKKYGIIISKGLKKGQHNNIIKKFKNRCLNCQKEFETTPSANKKYCSRKCMNLCKEYRLKLKLVNKTYMQSYEYRKSLMKDDTSEYKRYRNRVTKLSEQTYIKNKMLLNPNNYIRTKCGIEGGYQLDHKISVRECFDSGVTPEEASKLENLQILPWKQNLLKR